MTIAQWRIGPGVREYGSADAACGGGICGNGASGRPLQPAQAELDESDGPRAANVPAALAAPERFGTGTMIWECSVVLAHLLSFRPQLLDGLDLPTGTLHVGDGAQPAAAVGGGSAGEAAAGGSVVDRAAAGARVVVELGAGTGVAGLAAAALGASVLLTDVLQVLPLLRSNVEANRQIVDANGGAAHAAALDWVEWWAARAAGGQRGLDIAGHQVVSASESGAAGALAPAEVAARGVPTDGAGAGVGRLAATPPASPPLRTQESAPVLPAIPAPGEPHDLPVEPWLPVAPAAVGLVLAADIAYQKDGRGLRAFCQLVRALLHPEVPAHRAEEAGDSGAVCASGREGGGEPHRSASDGSRGVDGIRGGEMARPAALLLAHKSRHTSLDDLLLRLLQDEARLRVTEVRHGRSRAPGLPPVCTWHRYARLSRAPCGHSAHRAGSVHTLARSRRCRPPGQFASSCGASRGARHAGVTCCLHRHNPDDTFRPEDAPSTALPPGHRAQIPFALHHPQFRSESIRIFHGVPNHETPRHGAA
eukprot:scaffold6781_cov107-Isochrysis_galbana.AAC.11